eukprot:COSAG02_NODE_24_length_52386_cov_726.042898_13_plen_152_part_00
MHVLRPKSSRAEELLVLLDTGHKGLMPGVTLRRPGIPVSPGAWDRAYLWAPGAWDRAYLWAPGAWDRAYLWAPALGTGHEIMKSCFLLSYSTDCYDKLLSIFIEEGGGPGVETRASCTPSPSGLKCLVCNSSAYSGRKPYRETCLLFELLM